MQNVSQENISVIKKISSRLRFACNLIFFITPLLIIFYWFFYNQLPLDYQSELVSRFSQEKILPLITRILCTIITMIPCVIIMLASKYLIELFRHYEKTVFFSIDNVIYVRKLGKIVIIWAFMDIIVQTLLVFAISFNNSPGYRYLSINVGSFQLSSLLIGYIIVLFSRIMDEARIISEDQQYTI